MPGEVVECPTDTDRDCNAKALFHAIDPELLLRRPVGDEEDLRPMAMDQVQRLGIRRRVRRAVVRGHLEAWVLCAESRGQVGRDAGARAQEEESEFPARAHRRQRLDEIDSGDGRVQWAALPARRPDHAGSVRQAQVGRLEHTREVVVLTSTHHKLRIDRRDQVMPAAVHHRLDSLEGAVHIDAVHPHAQHSGLLHAGQLAGKVAGEVADG